MEHIQKIAFKDIGDHRGHLGFLESGRDIPFDIKRIYYITQVPAGVPRGFHSHKELEQVLLCLNGSVRIVAETNGERAEYVLNRSNEGLYMGPMTWREMYDFAPETVLLVLASEFYSEEDYIRDYQEHQRLAQSYFK